MSINEQNNKELITQELNKLNPDWHLIERLTRSVVDADSNQVRFSVDAGHIQRLGFELVAKQETALIELVKNAYDADATEVKILFDRSEREGGTLTITDNGSGMTLDVVKEAWMRISTNYKKENGVSSKYGRSRSGRKGIGRFAVQRLGKKLEITTEIEGHPKGIRVFFNWDEDFISGTDLSQIFSHVEEYDKPINQHGTTLNILELREAWTSVHFDRVWKGIIFLQSPFKPTKVVGKKNNQFEIDVGFEVVINNFVGNVSKQKLSIQTTFLDHALADISANINSEGLAEVHLKSLKLGIDEKVELPEKFILTGEVNFNTKYFIYRPELMSGVSLRSAQDLANLYGGIRIYRNGFRVLPYGERADDWLKLDRDTGRRSLLVPAANTHFFGHVDLTDKNIRFEETSSREGLLENEAFLELAKFVREAIEWAVLRIGSARNRKQTAGQKNFISELTTKRKPTEIINDVQTSLVTEITKNTNRPEAVRLHIEHKLEQAKAEMADYEQSVEQAKQASLEYEEMLRILASLGISIAIFGHEIKGSQSTMLSGLSIWKQLAQQVQDIHVRTELLASCHDTQEAAQRVFNLGNYIDKISSNNESRVLQSLSVRGAVERFFKQFSDYLKKQKITLELDLPLLNLRTIPMHASEIDSVLLNFLTNSIKSLAKSKVSERKIKVSMKPDGNYAVIHFEDNGTGIDEKIKHNIFDAFFTTNIGSDENTLEGVGTGLGLKIVSDIASSYGGSVKVVAPSEGYKCCFDFRVLKA